MKTKTIVVILTVILLLSFLSTASAKITCPRCHGTGQITENETCPTCGGTSETANVIRKKIFPPQASGTAAHPAVIVSGVFHNQLADVGVYGIATAEVKSSTETCTNTSAETYFPPGEDVTVTIVVEGIAFVPSLSCNIYLSSGGQSECPECGGTGTVPLTTVCPDCGGTGFVAALPGGETSSLIVGGVAVAVAAALVMIVVLAVKRRRVTEQSLRRLSPSEFQNWVIQRLSGRASSQKDSSMGIDGYTVEGYAIQAKQSDNVGRNIAESFASVMGRSKAKTGLIVAFNFGEDIFQGIVRVRLNYGLEIKTVTVRELIESKGRGY